MKSSGAKDRDRTKGKKEDTKATPSKRGKISWEKSRQTREGDLTQKEKDIEQLDIDELEQMESKIKEQIRLKKNNDVCRERTSPKVQEV